MIELDHSTETRDLLADLQFLGFSDNEAKAYLALLSVPMATAYEVSKLAGLPKANCYTILDGLSSKRVVQPVAKSPTRYRAVDPETLFERIAGSVEQRCERLKSRLTSLTRGRDEEYVWSITGKDQIDIKIVSMIEAAQDHIWIKCSEERLEHYKDELRRASQRGVKILIILFGTDIEKFKFSSKDKVYLHEGNGLPVGIAPHLMIFTRDFEEALIADLRGAAHGTHTRARPVVFVTDSLIRHELYIVEIFNELGDEISERFGPALLKLRQKYLPTEQVHALERMLEDLKEGKNPYASPSYGES